MKAFCWWRYCGMKPVQKYITGSLARQHNTVRQHLHTATTQETHSLQGIWLPTINGKVHSKHHVSTAFGRMQSNEVNGVLLLTSDGPLMKFSTNFCNSSRDHIFYYQLWQHNLLLKWNDSLQKIMHCIQGIIGHAWKCGISFKTHPPFIPVKEEL